MRDVFTDPQPGDVVESQVLRDQLHVHYVKNGQVYCGKWSKAGDDWGCVRGSVEKWREECIRVGAKVIQRAEECPEDLRVRQYPEVRHEG